MKTERFLRDDLQVVVQGSLSTSPSTECYHICTPEHQMFLNVQIIADKGKYYLKLDGEINGYVEKNFDNFPSFKTNPDALEYAKDFFMRIYQCRNLQLAQQS